MDGSTIAVLVALVGAWATQILLSNHQMRRFHRRSQQLRRLGTHMATGVAGSMYKRKVYALLVVDEHRRVAAAEQLSGWTVAAGLKPVPELVGLDLATVGRGDPPPGVRAKHWAAFDHAADFIRKELARTPARARRERVERTQQARHRRTTVAATAS
jgi:DNA-binding transcriptional regulator of glucitol operon